VGSRYSQHLLESPSRDYLEIELQLALGVSYITVQGMSSPSVPQAYTRARELAEKCGNERQLFQAIFGLWQNKGALGISREARVFSVELLQLAGHGQNDEFQLQAHHSAWTTDFFRGAWQRLVRTRPKGASFMIRSDTTRTASFTAVTTPGCARTTPPPTRLVSRLSG